MYFLQLIEIIKCISSLFKLLHKKLTTLQQKPILVIIIIIIIINPFNQHLNTIN